MHHGGTTHTRFSATPLASTRSRMYRSKTTTASDACNVKRETRSSSQATTPGRSHPAASASSGFMSITQ